MENRNIYPLKQILEVKHRRVEEAEKVVKEKQSVLLNEQNKLLQREADRDKVKTHKIEKLTQLRQTMDEGSTSPKIQQMKTYLKTIDEKLVLEEKKVKDQKELVAAAEKALKEAQEILRVKRQEVEKLLIHQKDWEKEMRKALEIIEGREEDELGSVIHSINQRRRSS